MVMFSIYYLLLFSFVIFMRWWFLLFLFLFLLLLSLLHILWQCTISRGDFLAMAMYGINTLLSIDHLRKNTSFDQVWYADDSAFGVETRSHIDHSHKTESYHLYLINLINIRRNLKYITLYFQYCGITYHTIKNKTSH